ncbi:MAG TPA: phage portal protein [Pedococcus sp.]|nr:phage portal protein [Pedococcus sp.]
MLTNATTPNSPEWWLLRLGQRLEDERPGLERLDSYWRGDHPLPFGHRKRREAYRKFQRMARTNFAALIAEALLERLRVVGFRAGSDEDAKVDKKAWSWWQANDMDSVSGLVHRAAVVMKRAYVFVGPNPDGGKEPLVTGEDPRQVIHEESPRNRRKILAVLKTWWDDVENRHYAVVFVGGQVHYYQAKRRESDTDKYLWMATQWEVERPAEDNPLGEPPVVVFRNRPDLCGNCLGEFEDVTDIQDRINTQVLDRLVISTMQAYRQRYATGVDITDANGNPSAGFDPGADLLWTVPDDKARFGDFAAADLTGVLNSVEADIAHIGSITRTPPHYLVGRIVNAAGEALAAAETGLCAKTMERLTEYSASWEQVYRLAGKLIGEEIPQDAEVMWADPQFRSLTEKAAASVQLVAAGVPWRTRMTILDFTPQEIARMVTERTQDAMLEAALAPPMQQQGGVGRSPAQSNGNGGTVSMRNGPGSGQGRAAAPQAALARNGSGG